MATNLVTGVAGCPVFRVSSSSRSDRKRIRSFSFRPGTINCGSRRFLRAKQGRKSVDRGSCGQIFYFSDRCALRLKLPVVRGHVVCCEGKNGASTVINGNALEGDALTYLKELVRMSKIELDNAMFQSQDAEAKAQEVAERAILLRDEAAEAVRAADAAQSLLEKFLVDEAATSEALEKAKGNFSLASMQVKSAEEALKAAALRISDGEGSANSGVSDEAMTAQLAWESAQAEFNKSQVAMKNCEEVLTRIRVKKMELQKDVARLTAIADTAKAVSHAADEDVSTTMLLAEKAVALQVEAAQRLSDAEITLQNFVATADPIIAGKAADIPGLDDTDLETRLASENISETVHTEAKLEDSVSASETAVETGDLVRGILSETRGGELHEAASKSASFPKKSETQKEVGESGILKSVIKRSSSRFLPASFFSFPQSTEFSPAAVFSGLLVTMKQHLPKVVAGACLVVGGGVYLGGQADKLAQLRLPSFEYNYTAGEFATKEDEKPFKIPARLKMLIDKISHQEMSDEEASLFDVLWLLLASVIFVPIFQKIPGGSPVLGYLAAGILIGPHSLHIIQNVHGTKAIAEFGVVFLLFNIGLELSVERLSSMRKYVFGFGSTQVLATALAAGIFAHYISGVSGPAAIVIGNGLALSSTAVVLQVLQERGESTSRHGRAAFSVLLFQDLAVVVLLILIPLISPSSSGGGIGFNAIAGALGIAAIKAVIAISGIIAGGRLLLRPIYKSMAENHNAEIFAANTLLVVLGTSVLTARSGLSMALGAFLAGLLLSETEFALQVESDIAPYRGLLLGLFFMTVGMSIDPKLFVAKFPVIMGALALLLIGKTMLVALLGRQFGLSNVAAIRAGLLLAPGGEFAFVAFGEAVNQGIMSPQQSSLMFLVVGLSMALTPWLAAAGQLIATKFEQQDVRNLLPAENETDDLQGHMIVCGFGRVGQIISQMLSERLIPFVALDVRSERVSMGRALDLPVYFGDAGSTEVLHKLGASRAAAAVITLDTPGANYRAVWALSKHFPNVKTYVRAHDVDHGINLEKAGATAVVPETLEPSLQLAAAILAEAKLPASEIGATINEFRSRHLSELTELTKASGTSLGYGFSKPQSTKISDEEGDKKLEGGVVAVP